MAKDIQERVTDYETFTRNLGLNGHRVSYSFCEKMRNDAYTELEKEEAPENDPCHRDANRNAGKMAKVEE